MESKYDLCCTLMNTGIGLKRALGKQLFIEKRCQIFHEVVKQQVSGEVEYLMTTSL